MNKFKNNESGFSAVEIVMVIVIVGLIGAVGYLVYKNQHKTTKTVVVTKAVKGPASKTTSSSLNSGSQAGAASILTVSLPAYMGVKESAIKIQLTSQISDAYYFNNGATILISVHSLDNIPGCIANNSINSGGVVALSSDAGRSANSNLAKDSNSVEIGNDWFELTRGEPTLNCSSKDTATQEKINSIISAFLAASKTITIAN